MDMQRTEREERSRKCRFFVLFGFFIFVLVRLWYFCIESNDPLLYILSSAVTLLGLVSSYRIWNRVSRQHTLLNRWRNDVRMTAEEIIEAMHREMLEERRGQNPNIGGLSQSQYDSLLQFSFNSSISAAGTISDGMRYSVLEEGNISVAVNSDEQSTKSQIDSESAISPTCCAVPSGHIEYGDSTCSVCLNDYQEKETLVRLECNHVFHKDCLWNWARRNNCCPLCKRIILDAPLSVVPDVIMDEQEERQRSITGMTVLRHEFI